MTLKDWLREKAQSRLEVLYLLTLGVLLGFLLRMLL